MTTWSWGNEHRLFQQLDKITDPAERDDLLDALDEILADPTGAGSSPMQGTGRHVRRRIALLPHGWALVYTEYPAGVPPFSAPILVVRGMFKMFEG